MEGTNDLNDHNEKKDENPEEIKRQCM
jgi:hypothetical protein